MKHALSVLMAASAVLQLALGGVMAVEPASALTAFGLNFTGGHELAVICTFFGLTLAAMGAFVLWVTVGFSQGSRHYDRFITGYGMMLCAIGLGGALLTGRTDALFIDFLRGGLILVLQYFAGRQLATA